MAFESILFEQPAQRVGVDERGEPSYFRDLNLDQIVEAITSGRGDYRLKPFFHTPLGGVPAVQYRQEVFRDLEVQTVRACVDAFAGGMRTMRGYLEQAEQLRHRYQKERWFLDAVQVYGEAITTLQRCLVHTEVNSRGLLAFRDYLTAYVESPEFLRLRSETTQVRAKLNGITYTLLIQGRRITIKPYDEELDYAAEVVDVFRKFSEDGGKVNAREAPANVGTHPNHIEEGILDRVALRFPEAFAALDAFRHDHRDYLDPKIAEFDREVQFYLGYLDFLNALKGAGLSFSYPDVSEHSKEVRAYDTFDLALANKLLYEGARVVVNDFALSDGERIIVVTGPNQGGKTTFARTFGQLHYLASLGCPVAGREARLLLYDRLFTHFEREEHMSDLRGKLQDDLLRIHAILEAATPRSIVILNEIFTSTTFRDALYLSTQVLRRIVELDLLCVWVTFLDELATMSETTVSMTSMVAPDDLTVRTYRVERRPADGRAYAAAIAEKYGLTFERLKERMRR